MSDAPERIWIDEESIPVLEHYDMTAKLDASDIEYLRIDLHQQALAEAQKWRECLEAYWEWQELKVELDSCPNFYPSLYEKLKEIKGKIELAESKFRALEKELRESHKQEAVCKE